MKIDYDNMVRNGCFSFLMIFMTIIIGYDIYSQNKILGAGLSVFISMVVFFYINNYSYKLNKNE